MRYYFSLFVVFSVSALVLAAPTGGKPATSVNKEDIRRGYVYWPRLKTLEPKDPSSHPDKASRNRNHPVIVVGDVDAQDKVKVAQLSSGKPTHWKSVEPASNYADLRGFINVGPPNTVHVAHLPAPRKHMAVRSGRLQPLIDRINTNCAADQQLPGCAEPSGSAQGNTVHGSPEPDHSKKSSQQSSSNKGSSSQVSRPGSPKQSSHSSSQGSQLGGSKQGSPSDSSDDGWQVVTGSRRRNTARGGRNK